jgi:acyl-coenzyme A thioesterase PaaI-like protein
MDVVHGGILTTCMDNAMAILNMFLAGEYFTPTLTMETKFLRPMQYDDALLVEVTAMAVGRQISHLRAEAKSEATGKTVATATATFMTTGLAARK